MSDLPPPPAVFGTEGLEATVNCFSLSGDWTEIAPGVRVRLRDAPNEEDMDHYEPHGVVILQVQRIPIPQRRIVSRDIQPEYGPDDAA